MKGPFCDLYLLFLSFLIPVVTIVSSVSHSNESVVGCYTSSPEYRAAMAADYNPDLLTHKICRGMCGKIEFSYAMIESGQLCFCGNDLVPDSRSVSSDFCGTPCPGDSTESCGSENYLTLMIATPKTEVHLDPYPGIFRVGEAQSLPIESVIGGNDIRFSFNFGDESPTTPYAVANASRHVYIIPGEFLASVTAYGGVMDPYTDYVEVSVEMSIAWFTVSCPYAIKENQTINCQFCVFAGSNMWLALNFNENFNEERINPFPISDPRLFEIGVGIPQYEQATYNCTGSMDSTCNMSEYKTLIFPGSEATDIGFIITVETYISEVGDGTFTILILKPYCNDTLSYCAPDNLCTSVCDGVWNNSFNPLSQGVCENQTFCLESKRCVDYENATAECSSSPVRHNIYQGGGSIEDPRTDYMIWDLIKLEGINRTGYVVINLQDYSKPLVEMEVGFVLGVSMAPDGAKLGFELAEDGEPVEYSYENQGGITDDDLKKRILKKERSNAVDLTTRHFLRVVASDPSVTLVTHTPLDSSRFVTVLGRVANELEGNGIEVNTSVEIQDEISGLEANISGKIFTVGEEVTVVSSVAKGTPVIVTFDWGDGVIDTIEDYPLYSNKTYTGKHIYLKGGIILIQAKASNYVSKTNTTFEINMQHPVLRNYEFSSDTPAEYPGFATYTVVYNDPGDVNPLPTGAMMMFSFGDNENSEILAYPFNGSGHSETVTHSFPSTGVYQSTFIIYNLVSREEFTTTVSVYEAISNLGLSFWYKPLLPVNSGYQPGAGEENNTLPSNLPFFVEATYDTGTAINFTFDLNGSRIETVENQYEFSFQPGTYQVTVWANNPLGSQGPVSATLNLYEPIDGIKIELASQPRIDEPTYFEMNISQVGTESCIAIDYGNSSTFDIYGVREICEGHQDYPDSIWRGELISTSVLLAHNYSHKHSFRVSVHGFNLVSFYDTYLYFALSDVVDCYVPKVKLENSHPDWRDPRKVIKNRSFLLQAVTGLTCAVTSSNFKQWLFEQINPLTGKTISGTKIELFDLPKTHKYYVKGANKSAEIKIPAGFLKPNIYKFSYQVKMDEIKTFGESIFSAAEEYVEICSSPLEVAILNGQSTRIEKGNDQQIYLEPELYSFDPDMDSTEANKNFTFMYFCRKVDEKWPLNDNLEIDTLAFVHYPPNNNGNASLGGCFGEGPGRLNHSAGSLVVSTRYLASGMDYIFFVIVEKDQRSSNASLVVTIIQGDPPEMSISCASGTGCVATDSGPKINPSYNQRFSGTCSYGCDNVVSYIWQVQGFREDLQEYHDISYAELEKHMTGLKSQELYVPSTFFGNYTDISEYSFTLTGTTADGVNGISYLTAYLNSPPTDGNCSVSPGEGVAGIDKFRVACTGWTDNDGISMYRLYSVENGKKSQLAFGSEPTWEVYLPQGNASDDYYLQLLVQPIDVYDATTELLLTKIKVNPPSTSQAENVFESISTNGYYDEVKGAGISKNIISVVTKDAIICNFLSSDVAADKEDRTKVRQSLINLCDSIQLNSLEDTEGVANALYTTTKQVDEVTLQDSAIIAGIFEKMADQVIGEITESAAAPEKILKPAVGIISCVGNLVGSISQYSSGNSTETFSRKDLEKIGETVQKTVEQQRRLSEGIIRNTIVGEPEKVISTDRLSLKLQKNTLKAMNGRGISAGKGAIRIPSFPSECQPKIGTLNNGTSNNGMSLSNCTETAEALNFEAAEYTSNPYIYSNSSSKVSTDSPIVALELRHSSGEILSVGPTENAFEIEIPRSTEEEPKWTYYQPIAEDDIEYLMFHNFDVTQKEVSISLELWPDIPSQHYAVYLAYNRRPNSADYDWKALIPNNISLAGNYDLVPSPYVLFIDNYEVSNKTNQTVGKYVIGVQELGWNSETVNGVGISLSDDPSPRDFTANYSLRVYNSACLFWDEDMEEFSSDGCRVGPMTGITVTQCFCNHLTSFVSGMVVPPNSIDFAYVFANMDFTKNLTIYVTSIVVFSLYFFGVIWARRKDIKDLETLGVTPLADNDLLDSYYYEIVVCTGQRKSAGTDSVVRFILSGEEDDTGVRSFSDDKRKIFRRGAVDRFLLATPESLGQLAYMRLWHDNSGQGKMQGWYLNYIQVKDLQTNKKYFFIANQWFSAVEDDGQIDRSIHVAGKEQIQNFEHVFSTNTRKAFGDGHMWFSILLRPPQSRFTRVQRLSCCFMALWLEMLTNIMFYESVPPPSSGGTAISLGPFSITLAEIAIGVESSLIVLPISLITVQLFRKSRPKNKRQSRFEKARQETKEHKKQKYVFTVDQGQEKKDLYRAVSRAESLSESIRPESAISPSRISIRSRSRTSVAPSPLSLFNFEEQKDIEKSFEIEDIETSKDVCKKEAPKKKKKSKDYPHFCVYIAWFLVFLGVAVSVTFVLFYAVSMGDTKTSQWFTSLIVSFITSVFFTQPIKVILVAILIALIFKKVDEDEDEENDEEDCKLADDEELLHPKPKSVRSKKKQRLEFQPPSGEELEEARNTRLKEIEMFSILREILFYSCYLTLLMVLTYSSTDKNAYNFKTAVLNHVAYGEFNYAEIKNMSAYWEWAEETLLPGIYTKEWYNGQTPTEHEDDYISDRASIVLGYPIIRQLRIMPEKCEVDPLLDGYIHECNVKYSTFDQDEDSYGVGWTKNLTTNDTIPSEYVYTSASELDSYPYWGKHAVYQGGGYVAKLDGNYTQSVETLIRLKEELWIDRYTRAVFIEFSLYNAQINLFGSVTLLTEFLASGGVFSTSRVYSLRLLTYQSGFALIQIVCEVLFVCFLVFYFIKEVNNFRRSRKKIDYLTDFWSIIEITTISLGFSIVALYAYRQYEVYTILSAFGESHGQDYIKLQFAAYWDENFKTLTGILVFIATLKFLKLLRFNQRVSILTSTLRTCAPDIMNYMVLFGIFFLGFTVLFFLLFNMHVYDFSDIIFTAESLLATIMGKFKFEQISQASPILGPIAFFFFILIVTFILINMFVTILNEGFGSAKADLEKQANEYEIVEFIIGRFKNLIGLSRPDRDNTIRINLDDELVPNALELENKLDCLVKSIARVHYDYQEEDLAALDWIDDYEINYKTWSDKKKGTGNSVKKVTIYLSDQ